MTFDAKPFLENLTQRPGVYQMFNKHKELLYVGKAKDLKKRVSSYFRGAHSTRIVQLVEQIDDIQIIVTPSNKEALLLECALIKQHRPKYNIILRDDKSYPYILISEHAYPNMIYSRGKPKDKGHAFGPYPSGGAVRDTLDLLQRLFKIRSCDDTFFSHRQRPCLSYQIKRCTAPCVKYISKEDYALDVQSAVLFLQGKDQTIIDDWVKKMDEAASSLDYEKAAILRDQIVMLRQIHEQQIIIGGKGDVDVIVALCLPALTCVQVLSVRKGQVLGSTSHFPIVPTDTPVGLILNDFMQQYYLNREILDIPEQIVINHPLVEADDTELELSELLGQIIGYKIKISHKAKGIKFKWLQMATSTAEQAIAARLSAKRYQLKRLEALQKLLGLETYPKRLMCFDISHTLGDSTVASAVVFKDGVPAKKEYRRYNITQAIKGDDYGAMREALLKHFTKLKSQEASTGQGGQKGFDLLSGDLSQESLLQKLSNDENSTNILHYPDILFIDGGKGQLNSAHQALDELQVQNMLIIGIAKGEGRKPGLETLFIKNEEGAYQEIDIQPTSSALHLIQHIRDESHRFAITAHRKQRSKKTITSSLEGIPGVGPKKRSDLLKYFGGLQELSNAAKSEIAKVPGVGPSLADKIYDFLHPHTN